MWKQVLAALCFTILTAQGLATDRLQLSLSVKDPVTFISHQGAAGGYWLGENVNYEPVANLLSQLQQRLPSETLKNRGDSHITVLTPPEYLILKPYLSPESLDKIAMQENIQQSSFHVVCLGQGQAVSKYGVVLNTYFLVVKSPDLVRLRKKIFEQFVAHGGMPSRFDPDHFTPHITVGFTERDLFEQDGVYKQKNSCFLPVKIV
ncbi:MAG: hypothetical protein P1U40_14610 [Coxiellaceae bacterium]|nr:hypothetical protein [Coxiellaceae bacterium]